MDLNDKYRAFLMMNQEQEASELLRANFDDMERKNYRNQSA